MKRILPLLTLLFSLCTANSYSENYHESDKEGLRKILRYKGVDHDRSTETGLIVDLEGVNNFETYGLAESDTLSWYTSEDWVEKINTTLTWNENSPKRLIKASFKHGVEGSYFDMSYFANIENANIDISYFIRPVITTLTINKKATVDLSANNNLKTVDLTYVDLIGEIPLPAENNITNLAIEGYTNQTVTNYFLQLFPKLDTLVFFQAGTELDFSNNTELKYIYVKPPSVSSGRHGIEKMDLTQCHKLEELYCAEGSLEELYISDQARLKTLDCMDNKLRYLKMPCNPIGNPVIENYIASYQFMLGSFDVENIYATDILDLSAYVEFGGVKTTITCSYSDDPEDDDIEEVGPGKFLIPAKLANKQMAASINNPCFGGAVVNLTYNILPKTTTNIQPENSEGKIILKNAFVRVNETIAINSPEAGTVLLYDMSGRQISETALTGGDNYIMSPSVNGSYLLKVMLNNGVSKTFKIQVK